jgi:hypothetical protein
MYVVVISMSINYYDSMYHEKGWFIYGIGRLHSWVMDKFVMGIVIYVVIL